MKMKKNLTQNEINPIYQPAPQNFTIVLNRNLSYYTKRYGDYITCHVEQGLKLVFPSTPEGMLQAMVTNYIVRRKLISTAKAISIKPFEFLPVDLENDNTYEYDAEHLMAQVTTARLEFPVETETMQVSFPDIYDCYHRCNKEEYADAVKRYEFLIATTDADAIERYELGMRSMANAEYKEDICDPYLLEDDDDSDPFYNSLFFDLI